MGFIKFDTRDKKPSLWNVLVLSCLFAAGILLLFRFGDDRRLAVFCVLMDLYLAVVVILLVIAFFGQLQYNPYSYNTIIYSGFSLFILTVLVRFSIFTVQVFRYPERYAGTAAENLTAVANMLLGSAMAYMRLSLPFILLFSAALCISNIALIRHEGRRLVNLLGIILSFLLVGGDLFLFRPDSHVFETLARLRLYALFQNLFAAVYLYFECMLIGTGIAVTIAALREPEPDRDFLIILGCGLRRDGTPSPLLRGRIDRALAFRDRQAAQTGRDLVFVTSGGQGPDEVIPESASMKRYLMEQGVPEDRIIEEDRSLCTLENMEFSKEKIREAGETGRVAYCTTNYHVFRGGLCARRVKMRAVGMAAKTKWYFWPNASVREFVGLLTDHRGKQALLLGGMTVFYIILTLAVYRG